MFRRFRNTPKAPKEIAYKTSTDDALLLLFNALPKINAERLAQTLLSLEPNGRGERPSVAVSTQEPGKTFLASIAFDEHRLRLVGFNTPVPQAVIDRTITPSHWQSEQKTPLLSHRSHAVCYYEGANPDPTEQHIARYKLAASFLDKGLLGTLDEKAWNCMPADFVQYQMEQESLAAAREAVPIGLWTGFVKFFRPDGNIWFCTKGHERFNAPNFAFLGTPDESNTAFKLFNQLFHYVREYNVPLAVGHTAEMKGTRLAFSEVREYHEYLEAETLVVTVD